MREVIKTGRTVEDATELALAELGVSAEEAVQEHPGQGARLCGG